MFGQPLIWGKQSKEAVHLLKWYFLILNGKLAGDPESLQSNGSWYVFCVCVCVPCVMLRLGILGVGLFAGEVFLRLLAGPGVEHKKDTVQEPWGFSHPAFNKESF